MFVLKHACTCMILKVGACPRPHVLAKRADFWELVSTVDTYAHIRPPKAWLVCDDSGFFKTKTQKLLLSLRMCSELCMGS